MKNKIQFQKGMSVNELMKSYGTEDQCVSALEGMRWPKGFVCPKCASKKYAIVYHGRARTYRCIPCKAETTLTGNTIFHSTKLALTVWFQAIYFLTQTKNDISALELKRLIGVGYCTAWRIKHKLMQVMYLREQATVLSGTIEMDDSYLGGEANGGKRGRGSENKAPFIAAVQKNKEGHPLYAVFSPVKTFSKEEVESFSLAHIDPSATVVSDGLACFKAVGCAHEPVIVGKGRKSTKMECFNWINTILGNLKTAITGTLHGFKFRKYIGRYLGEYQYRFNRRFDLASMVPRLLYAAINTGKHPEYVLKAE